MEKLSEKINELAEKKEHLPTKVIFQADFQEIQVLNKALKNASSEEERFRLTMDLFELWMRGKSQEDIDKIFGKEFVKEKSGSVMFSLTAPGTQLRVWNGLPAEIEENHVDSCGRNLILTISGNRGKVREYLEAILEMKIGRYGEAKFMNGTSIFMHVRW